MTDIEIARSIKLTKVNEIAKQIGIDEENLSNYGHYIAKVDNKLIDDEKVKRSKLILVTAITPTKAGIGKTTVSVGLALGMNKIGKKCVVALREPSLGPCFGMKGGAAGGGMAQVLPMEKINLHFTGDFHAITSANNMIAALLDNYQYQNRDKGFALKEVLWRRVLDVNDRALRYITTGLGPKTNGFAQETGFDITPASEIMAILCLSKDEDDLRRRIGNILLGFTIDNKPFTVNDMGVTGSIVALLKDALQPNLVQTTEHTPAFVHGGPFANIAHGCNSIIATKMAMSHSDYTITEAGFGADLGAEKFLDIKCRHAELNPALTVLVVTARALKLHGGVPNDELKGTNIEALETGLANMDKHLQNLQAFGQTVVIAFNRYGDDSEEEIAHVRAHCEKLGVGIAVNNAYVEGGDGAKELAELVVKTIDEQPSKPLEFMYTLDQTVEEKITAVCKKVYGAASVTFDKAAKNKMAQIAALGYDKFPVCIAKTQYSFSTDAKALNVPTGFNVKIQDIVINAGAELLVAISGTIMRMPGLPKEPQALHIDVVNGEIDGLS